MQNEQHRNSLYSISGVEFEGEDMAKFGQIHGPLDESIKSEATESLKSLSELNDSKIDVEVEDGTIFLRGEVPDLELKRLAHECVGNIKGVSEVVNQLHLR